MSRQKKIAEAPVFLNLSTKELTDTDRVIALQLAQSFAERFRMPNDREHLEPLVLAFSNGVSFARAWERLTSEQRSQTEAYYKPLADELFSKIDASQN